MAPVKNRMLRAILLSIAMHLAICLALYVPDIQDAGKPKRNPGAILTGVLHGAPAQDNLRNEGKRPAEPSGPNSKPHVAIKDSHFSPNFRLTVPTHAPVAVRGNAIQEAAVEASVAGRLSISSEAITTYKIKLARECRGSLDQFNQKFVTLSDRRLVLLIALPPTSMPIVSLQQTSGDASLDQFAVDMLTAATRKVEMPLELKAVEMMIEMPIAFESPK